MGKYINKNIIDNSILLSWGFRMYSKFNFLLYSDKVFLERAFKKRFNKTLDWENPKTFQEKLQWLKLFHRTELQTQCADKIAVRDYVTEKIGEQYLIPQLQILNNAKELNAENLPEIPFIIKCNHNSGGYTIVRNKSSIDWKKERLKFANLLKQNYYYQSREWQYKNIQSKIIIEQLLLDENDSIPEDFKIYCFNGEAKFIQVDINRQTNHSRNFYDSSWNLLPYEFIYPKGDSVKKPKKLNLMLKLANKLSESFPFARVDFYSLEKEVFFGEITFQPESGFSAFNEEKYDIELGTYLSLKNLK